jgi:hypothetical protein
MRWLLMLTFLAGCYSFAVGIIFRNIPITILWTNVKVRFMNAEGTRVEITREQMLRANQPGVTAYFASSQPTNGGIVPHDQIKGSAFCDSHNLNDQIEVTGSPAGKTEMMHIFGAALPYRWFMPLIPASLLNREHKRLPKFLRTYAIVRNHSVVYLNEYNGPKPVMQFATTSGLYHHFNMAIDLDFGPKQVPASLRIRRIQNNGVIDVNFERKPGNVVGVLIDRMKTETLRITWEQVPSPPIPI